MKIFVIIKNRLTATSFFLPTKSTRTALGHGIHIAALYSLRKQKPDLRDEATQKF